MTVKQRWYPLAAGLFTSWALLACGGGGGGSNAASPNATTAAAAAVAAALTQEPNAPVLTNNTAIDGLNWINYRRTQSGLAALQRNVALDSAAQGHTDYQKNNNKVSHDQTAGLPGFTGAQLEQRLAKAGYALSGDYAFGEVISATSNSSGFYMAEELITAIYHRFVIFEPQFRQIGTGYAINSSNYSYFTTNFGATAGIGPALGAGNVVTWPANGQTRVAANFFSDFEEPDPVPNMNEVGYPISVHADLRAQVAVRSFTIRPRGGAELSVKLLKFGGDSYTPSSAAAIIPLAPLRANTVYDVSFTGSSQNVDINRNWSFTTR